MPSLSSRRKRIAVLAAGAVVLAGAGVGTWAWAALPGDVVSKCQESGDREYQETLTLLKKGSGA
ncbi:hypothetical protein [Streptomyces sp. NPDC002671]